MFPLKNGARINVKYKDSPLYFAIKEGRTTIVKHLLQQGTKIDNEDRNGKTILQFAVEVGYLTIVEEILKYNPDIDNESNRTSLRISLNGHGDEYKKITQLLLEYGFNVKPKDANNSQLLHAAVEKGYLEIVKDLLKYGADVNMVHNSIVDESSTPLHRAVKNKQEETAKLLINCGANINAQDKSGNTSIVYAVDNADLKITMLLLTNGAHVKINPLLLGIAVKKECMEIIEVLLQYGVNINATDQCQRTALHFTALRENESIFGFLSEDSDSNVKGEIAKFLLSKGANVNSETKDGVRVLHIASENGLEKVVEALLEYNADVNFASTSGITPLHISAQKGNEKICQILLNNGADVNAKRGENLFTPLHIASENDKSANVVKILLKHGAEVDSKTDKGYTPLQICALNNCPINIKIILKFDPDIDSRDDFGRTALHMASQHRYVKIVKILLNHGSDINITNKSNRTPFEFIFQYFPHVNYYNHRALTNAKKLNKLITRHIVKMKTANFYVSERNLQLLYNSLEIDDFQFDCEEEMTRLKCEKIDNTNISFFYILTKGKSTLAMCLRNKNIVHVLISNDYERKYPIYASMIKFNFKNGMKRRQLLDQGYKIFPLLFRSYPKLQQFYAEKIFSFLSDKDLRNLIDAYPLDINMHNSYL